MAASTLNPIADGTKEYDALQELFHRREGGCSEKNLDEPARVYQKNFLMMRAALIGGFQQAGKVLDRIFTTPMGTAWLQAAAAKKKQSPKDGHFLLIKEVDRLYRFNQLFGEAAPMDSTLDVWLRSRSTTSWEEGLVLSVGISGVRCNQPYWHTVDMDVLARYLLDPLVYKEQWLRKLLELQADDTQTIDLLVRVLGEIPRK